MKTLFHVCLLMLLFSACRTPEKSLFSAHFNTGKLPAQSFVINPNNDTTLVTGGGVRIHIAKGSFAYGKMVTIEWKEALDFQSVLKAGLLTQSGNNILRSGGMFYFNTKEKLAIQKPIGIDVPAETIVSGMQLYKGDSADGKIDWQDPKPIENVKAFEENAAGKALFNGHCAQCHGIDKPGTGPALAGITARKSKEWLYAVTHNTAAMMAIDPYLQCEKCRYGVVMQAFPALSEAVMDSVYDYIEDETERLGLTGNIKNNDCDSCAIYDAAYDSLLGVYNKLYPIQYLQKDSSVFGELGSSANPVNYSTENKSLTIVAQGSKYYNVSIQSEGWYNIDALLKTQLSVETTKLIIKPQNDKSQQIAYYLAIPALKILTEGSNLDDGAKIVFQEEDGTIMLPQLRQAFIIALGINGENYFFSKKSFIISSEQTINLSIQKISKSQFDAQLTELSYYGLNSNIDTVIVSSGSDIVNVGKQNISATTIGNGYEKPLTGIEQQLKQLSAKKMKDCGCPSANTSRDTGSAIRSEQTTAPKTAPNK